MSPLILRCPPITKEPDPGYWAEVDLDFHRAGLGSVYDYTLHQVSAFNKILIKEGIAMAKATGNIQAIAEVQAELMDVDEELATEIMG